MRKVSIQVNITWQYLLPPPNREHIEPAKFEDLKSMILALVQWLKTVSKTRTLSVEAELWSYRYWDVIEEDGMLEKPDLAFSRFVELWEMSEGFQNVETVVIKRFWSK